MSNANQLLPTGRFGRILLATDGSGFSSGAEEMAFRMAQRFGGRITALQMVLSNPEYEAMALGLVEKQEQGAIAYLKQLKERITQQGVNCDFLVKRGVHPHEEIIEAAEEIQADLVVMGRRGRRGLARLMVGDATARVVARSKCNVLVVPRQTGVCSSGILLGTDGSRFSDRAGVVATLIAQNAGIPLYVISSIEDKTDASHARTANEAVERVVAHAREQGVTVHGSVVEGHRPAEVLARELQRTGADLLVGGSHGRSGMERVFLGSVMERVIGLVTCPVLAVKGG